MRTDEDFDLTPPEWPQPGQVPAWAVEFVKYGLEHPDERLVLTQRGWRWIK